MAGCVTAGRSSWSDNRASLGSSRSGGETENGVPSLDKLEEDKENRERFEMSGDATSDEESSQEDPVQYDVDDLEMVKTIGETDFGSRLSIRFAV